MFLLDTNICIYLIREHPPSVINRLKNYSISDVKVSSVTSAELFYRVEKSGQKERNRNALIKFLSPFEIIPFTDSDAIEYGKIRARLEEKGNIIGPYDLQIAAQAKSRSWKLVTNNEKEFKRVSGIKIENWTK